jgi:hypothetical protein
MGPFFPHPENHHCEGGKKFGLFGTKQTAITVISQHILMRSIKGKKISNKGLGV